MSRMCLLWGIEEETSYEARSLWVGVRVCLTIGGAQFISDFRGIDSSDRLSI